MFSSVSVVKEILDYPGGTSSITIVMVIIIRLHSLRLPYTFRGVSPPSKVARQVKL